MWNMWLRAEWWWNNNTKGPLQSSLMEYTDGSTLHNRQDLKIIKLHPCLLVESLTTTMHKNHIQCDGPSIVTQCTNIDNYLQTQCCTRLQRIIFWFRRDFLFYRSLFPTWLLETYSSTHWFNTTSTLPEYR